MPSVDEYKQDMMDVASAILGVEVTSKAQVIHLGALAKSAVVKKRNQLTQGITKAWKDGYATLKGENDQMQQYLAEAYRDIHADINDAVADMLKKAKK